MNIKISSFSNNKNVVYTVGENETLEEIANCLGVSKSYILQHNSESIYEGKVLFLPEIELKTYIVKPFDSLQTIAKDKNISVEELKAKNQLDSDYLFVGQKLFL